VYTNRAGKTIRPNKKISSRDIPSYYELKMHKYWFDEECSELLDQKKQAKLHWLQDPREINGDNLNKIIRETSKHFRKKKGNI
jgi:hypothetical protein